MPSEYRHMSSGSLNIPPPTAANGNSGGPPPVGGMGRFDGPRSPPGRQNTSHVPCKFFRQGACQAGSACPFSHDLASTTENVCKYFAKGNCKFGPKCANVHVLPDGRRVNYKPGGPMTAGQLNIGGRLNTDLYHSQTSGSALTNGFIRASATPQSPYGGQYSPFANQDDGYPTLPRQTSIDIAVPTIDTSYASHTTSNYGSPRDDHMDRFGLGLSPVGPKGLSVLDAPLPASFDSNGVSHIARYGPMASSVPSKFGFDSPPGSVGAAKDGRTSEALKNLHSSAFGNDTRDRFNGVASSPPQHSDEQLFGKRPMHSQRMTKSKIMSSSLPKAVDLDWDSGFAHEEDYLPETLRDLMTPQEKARRGSRAAADEEGRPIYSGSGTPNGEISKFGSPSNASPSRWGPLFQRQKEEEERAAASRASAFGHVGSPLRNSSLHPSASPGSRPAARPLVSGDSSPYLASPPRHSSMSILSQQLQRTRLNNRTESSESQTSRTASNPVGSTSRPAMAIDRTISSGSIGNVGRIDEERDDNLGVFDMEEMGDHDERKGEKRNSYGWSYANSTRSPNLGAISKPRNGNGTPSGYEGLPALR
ncbi:CCCH zinc finger [Glarea lozoyensis ATCC 20868]|uniref:CCCH zinc finger n=1 Tax=Glarea lozoyensis (strain ATCC 20868 / MF5171) TaxID=1116229 RepID=S3D798_GLAL2|nr:CCCH zinc finger [Glarea lozoyensis ATCC 20868]EPE34362.1 CCCH zinc finger [Glarea lozoyensis ATCC 20868]